MYKIDLHNTSNYLSQSATKVNNKLSNRSTKDGILLQKQQRNTSSLRIRKKKRPYRVSVIKVLIHKN